MPKRPQKDFDYALWAFIRFWLSTSHAESNNISNLVEFRGQIPNGFGVCIMELGDFFKFMKNKKQM